MDAGRDPGDNFLMIVIFECSTRPSGQRQFSSRTARCGFFVAVGVKFSDMLLRL